MAVKQIQFAYDSTWSDRKKTLKVTWREVMEKGIIAFELERGNEPVPEPEPEEKKDEESYLLLDKDQEVIKREFDVLKEKMWRTCPFDEIELDSVFRIRDDNVVLKINDFKKFIKKGHTVERDENNYCLVLPQK
jgi:hypothetical protein